MKPAIITLAGIGPAAVSALTEHGISTLAKLAKASVTKIASIPGFSEARATRTIADAAELLAASAKNRPAKAGGKEGKKDKRGKKGKGKNKNKGKNKGKGKNGDKRKGKNKGKGKGKGKKKGKK